MPTQNGCIYNESTAIPTTREGLYWSRLPCDYYENSIDLLFVSFENQHLPFVSEMLPTPREDMQWRLYSASDSWSWVYFTSRMCWYHPIAALTSRDFAQTQVDACVKRCGIRPFKDWYDEGVPRHHSLLRIDFLQRLVHSTVDLGITIHHETRCAQSIPRIPRSG